MVAAKATSTALDGSDIDALLAIARAPSLVDAERHAAFLRGLLGPEAPALEPLIDSLLERAGELERAKRLAALDALTGIANRRTFAEALRRELSRAERSGKPLSVILFDLDDFKAINDSFSHAAGDRALQLVARCAEGVTREGDLVARLGGDEFAVLLPETGERGAREIGERIRSRLAQASEDGLSLQLSLGLGVVSGLHTSASALLAVADREMYRDKAMRKSLRPASPLSRS